MKNQWWDDDNAFSGAGLSIIFRDVLLCAAGGFAVLMVVILAAVNKPGSKKIHQSSPPGNIIIESYWPDSLNDDIDQWVKGPVGVPVGYSNLVGEHYNLLRDDLGKNSKDDPVNYEVTYSRGLPSGMHCVNLHLYSSRSKVLPIVVKVTVKIAKGDPGTATIKGGDQPVLVTDVKLRNQGQEINVFCFFIDKNGDLVAEKTFQSDAIRLRSASDTMPGGT